jgi:hypothetical protein
MQYQTTPKTVEEYLTAFPIQMEEVNTVIGRPTFTKANKVMVALKTNYIAMEDTRSNLGKLHCIMDTKQIEADKQTISPSTDPGQIDFNDLDLTDTTFPEAREAYMIVYTQRKYLWDSDRNLTGFRLQRQYWRQFWGHFFKRGMSPSKIGPIAPFLDTIQGKVPLEPVFFECVAEVRDSPNSFRIE